MDASSEREEAVDYSFDIQVPWMGSSYFAVVVSASDEHLGNVVAAYIDWDHFALHDADVEACDSSYRFDTLTENK